MPRLDVLLARNLGWSRAAARDAVDSGRVRLTSPGAGDGDAGTAPEARATIAAAALPLDVTVDNGPVRLHDVVHLLMNKPLGVVTALRDERYPTAYNLLRRAPLYAELRPVGRLDLDSSGLLLWTTDGTWLHRLTHPRHAVPRTYHAALARPFHAPPPGLTLDDGHRPDLRALAPLARAEVHPALAVSDQATAFATVTIVGGAYHEVRRLFAALGSHVLGLCRVGFGRAALPADLTPGNYRPVAPDDV